MGASWHARVMAMLLLVACGPGWAGPSPDAWLAAHPRVAAAIRWRSPGENVGRPHAEWPARDRQLLARHYAAALAQAWLPLPDPPDNLATGEEEWDAAPSMLSSEDARNLFMAWVGHALAVEAERRVPWSLDDLPDDQLADLLGSDAFFTPRQDGRGYMIDNLLHGNATPAPPRVAWTFLAGNRLVRETPAATVTAVCEWGRRLCHYCVYPGISNLDNNYRHWGYRGKPPVSAMMAGTALREVGGHPAETEVRHYVAGCHGTAGFLRGVLRAVNIPAREVSFGGHATVVFPSCGLALSHGDDLYTQTVTEAPIGEILISADTWEHWFGRNRSEEELRRDNIGRRPVELALVYGSPYLTRCHREDVAEGRARENSRVYEVFRSFFTVAEVDQAGVWWRLDQSLAREAMPEKDGVAEGRVTLPDPAVESRAKEDGAATVAIAAKWAELGGADGFLGKPETAVCTCPDGKGRYVHYAGGSIYWSPATGAHAIYGAIRDQWAALGWESNPHLGYPTTDEADAPDGGRFSRFEKGGAIYWHPQRGVEVRLDVRD